MQIKQIVFFFFVTVALLSACEKSNGGDIGASDWNPTDEELFASDFFEKYTDPVSGVVSYWFRDELLGQQRYNTQSNYFVTKSMTDDARFCYFFVSTKEKNGDVPTEKSARVFDFKERKLYTFLGNDGCYPYLDPKEDKLYFYIMKSKSGDVRDGGRFYMKDLLNAPKTTISLADLPKSIAPTGSYVSRAASHVTLTQDKRKVFIDAVVNDVFIQGLLDLYTGEWEEWGRNNKVHLTHGQLNPKRDDEALLAIDVWTTGDGIEIPIENDKDGAYGGKGTYPRMQLMSPDGSRKTIKPSPDNNYATHEMWHQDGDHVYWCAGGVNIRNIRTGAYEYIYDKRATHCNLTEDKQYVTFDNDHPDYYRGGRWKVSFLNRKTGKVVDIITERPAITTEDKPSRIHPDPHPHFVCNDKYIVCTASDKEGYLRWSITPVDQLIRLTSK